MGLQMFLGCIYSMDTSRESMEFDDTVILVAFCELSGVIFFSEIHDLFIAHSYHISFGRSKFDVVLWCYVVVMFNILEVISFR